MRQRLRPSVWSLGAAAAVVLVVGTGVVLGPGRLRRAVVERAATRGVALGVDEVRIHWRDIELRGLSGRLEGVDGISMAAGVVRIPWALRGLGDPTAESLRIEARGSLETLRTALGGWRSRHEKAGSPKAQGAGRHFAANGAKLEWRGAGDELVSGTVGGVTWDGETLSAREATGECSLRGVVFRWEGATLAIARDGGQLKELHVARLLVERPEPDGLPAPKAFATTAAASVSADLWARVAEGRAKLDGVLKRLAVGADVSVDALTLSLPSVRVGPWAARLIVGADASILEVDPGTGSKASALALRAVVPRTRGTLSAEVKYGPATLEGLGIAEGSFGLSELGKSRAEVRGSFEVDPDAKTLAADGSLTIENATLGDPRIADAPLEGLDLKIRGIVASRGDLRSWTLSGGSVELGRLRVDLDGGFERLVDERGGALGARVWGGWTVPTTPCNDALASLPKALTSTLDGLELSGTFGAHGRLSLDTRAIDRTELELSLDQQCHVAKAPPLLDAQRFKKPFELRVYDPKGHPKVVTFGPGSDGWTPLESISPYVVDALLTCEDGAFFSHNGFSYQAIRNALLANVKAGKFALGASTVTMQLAKNLFLDRRKLASRKLQEALLTIWLEDAVGKSGILELYLNVVEFGPNLYGIGPASRHYFGRPPSELDPLEATFLVSILPSPVRKHAMYDRGTVGAGYLAYLRTLLKIEHERGRLDDDELTAALDHDLVFHKQGDPPPPPHGRLKVIKDKDWAPSDDAFDPSLVPPDE